MKELFKILSPIPGAVGWPVAFVLQIILQVIVACMLGMTILCTIAAALLLSVFNLYVSLCVAFMHASGPIDYLLKSATVALTFGGVLNGAVIAVSMFFATSGFLVPFLVSVIGATVIHMCVALPMALVWRCNEGGNQ